ncbi:nitronate monooxygenase [Actinoplanes sp. NPDC051343]|uniref:nitronate monooxygenase n=1 Tax=Actinoplanes sp. NPDC051343 TaxID=3363906 RepID=UPI0037B02542
MDDLIRPVVVAPMAGGPTTTALVTGAADAGALAFLAAGYKKPETVEDELRAVRNIPHGLNIFVPMPPAPDVEALERYRRLLQPEAERFQVDLPPLRLHDDDSFGAKVALAETYAVPVVSFTFGVPERTIVERLRRAGSRVLITVTDRDEARRALAVQPDGLIAQAGAAGAHSSTTDPAHFQGDTSAEQVLAEVRACTDKPVIVAGGVMSAADAYALLEKGAAAVQCGTAFLLADEAATREAQRDAMLKRVYQKTVVTRAFTGQPARGFANRFTEAYSKAAPIGYPAIHHLTAPIRAAAAKLGDAGSLNLWAGTGHARARTGSVADLVAHLTP